LLLQLRTQKLKGFQLQGGFAPDQGLCPWTPLGAPPPDSRYRLALPRSPCPQPKPRKHDTLASPLFFILSQCLADHQCSVKTHERIELVFGAQGSLRLILNCYKGIPLLTKIRVLDSLCKFVSNSILSHFSFFATANDLRVLSTQFDRCKFITPSTSIFVYNTLTMTQITSLCLQQLDLWFCLLFGGGITLHWSGFKVKFRTAERRWC